LAFVLPRASDRRRGVAIHALCFVLVWVVGVIKLLALTEPVPTTVRWRLQHPGRVCLDPLAVCVVPVPVGIHHVLLRRRRRRRGQLVIVKLIVQS